MEVFEEEDPQGSFTGKRRCTYKFCPRPEDSREYYSINSGFKAGGQDWSALLGMTLCKACYACYSKNGSLTRQSPSTEISDEEKVCSYDLCARPTESSHFYRVRPGCTTGGQNWDALVGRVLCRACYNCFTKRGTLERFVQTMMPGKRSTPHAHLHVPEEFAGAQSESFSRLDGLSHTGAEEAIIHIAPVRRPQAPARPLAPEEKRCQYTHCMNPTESRQFTKIQEGTTAGGRDWSSMIGMVLCRACYRMYSKRGTLERTAPSAPRPAPSHSNSSSGEQSSLLGGKRKELEESSEGADEIDGDWDEIVGKIGGGQKRLALGHRRCSFQHCDRLTQAFAVEESSTKEWIEVEGTVLCEACSLFFYE